MLIDCQAINLIPTSADASPLPVTCLEQGARSCDDVVISAACRALQLVTGTAM